MIRHLGRDALSCLCRGILPAHWEKTMKHFSDSSCEKIMAASNAIDKAAGELDELPESERLSQVIAELSTVVAKLDAILKDEEF